MGLFECHFVANQYHSQFINCWRGLINGVLICIGAGRLGRDSDPAIGILIVTNGMYADPFAEPYRTPLGAGWVRITSVEGTVVHLLAEDNETAFLFDLDSRQWQILTPVPFVAHDYTAADLAGPTVAAWETQVQGEVEGRMTEVARDKSRRTATPMSTPLPPTPTLGIGLISDTLCDVLHFDREPLFTSCWHTQVNNVVVFVAVGYIPEQILGKEYSLPARQRLWVCIEPGCTTTHPNTGLPAPSIDLHITGVRGPLIMLASRDPTAPDQFVFDLILHRWQRMAAQP